MHFWLMVGTVEFRDDYYMRFSRTRLDCLNISIVRENEGDYYGKTINETC